jgi:adenylate cyclase
VALDATFAPAYVAMAMTCLWDGQVFVAVPLQQAGVLTRSWAQQAVELDPNDADAQAMLAWANGMEGINEEARNGASLAVTLNPNSAFANTTLGVIRLYDGQPALARDAFLEALRLSPRDPLNCIPLQQIGVSYYFARDYANAAEAGRRVVAQFPGFPLAYRYVAASLGQLGYKEDARAALQRAIEVSPQTFELYVRSRPPWFRSDDHEHMLEGLRKAGWQG